MSKDVEFNQNVIHPIHDDLLKTSSNPTDLVQKPVAKSSFLKNEFGHAEETYRHARKMFAVEETFIITISHPSLYMIGANVRFFIRYFS